MLTEEEAATNWCPFVRHHGTPSDDSISNRPGGERSDVYCIGSACMAWRWGTPVSVNNNPHAKSRLFNPTGGDVLGYCGLASKPEKL